MMSCNALFYVGVHVITYPRLNSDAGFANLCKKGTSLFYGGFDEFRI